MWPLPHTGSLRLLGEFLKASYCATVVVAHKPRGSAQGFVKPTCPVRKALSSTHIRKESVSMSTYIGWEPINISKAGQRM